MWKRELLVCTSLLYKAPLLSFLVDSNKQPDNNTIKHIQTLFLLSAVPSLFLPRVPGVIQPTCGEVYHHLLLSLLGGSCTAAQARLL